MQAFKRYLLFFLQVTFFFSIYSYILDLVYYKRDYGTSENYFYSFWAYVVLFITACLPISLPVSLFYNWISENGFEKLKGRHLIRMIYALMIGFFIGFALGDGGSGFYIGKYRAEKNLILYPAILLSAEIARIVLNKVKNRTKKVT